MSGRICYGLKRLMTVHHLTIKIIKESPDGKRANITRPFP